MHPALASGLIAAAWRTLYKLAEHQKWLPKGIYFRKSLDCLKKGDLSGAEKFNKIALSKSALYEKSLILKEIISLKRDTSISKLKEEMIQQEEKILFVLHRRKQIRNTVFRAGLFPRFIICSFVLFLGSSACMMFFLFTDSMNSQQQIWYYVTGGSVLISFILFLFLHSKKTEITSRLEESKAILAALDKEQRISEKEIESLKYEIDMLESQR